MRERERERERERDRVSGGRAERESQAGSAPSAQSLRRGSNPPKPRAKTKRQTLNQPSRGAGIRDVGAGPPVKTSIKPHTKMTI